MRFIFFIFILLIAPPHGAAQDGIAKDYQLKDSTFIRTYTLNIPKGTGYVDCKATGSIRTGEVYFRVIDPEGKQEGGLGLMADMKDDVKNDSANGIMTDRFKWPYPGTWTVQIQSDNASGEFHFEIRYQ